MKPLTTKQSRRLLAVLYVVFFLLLGLDTFIILYAKFRSKADPGIVDEPDGAGPFDVSKGLSLWLKLDEEKDAKAMDASGHWQPGLLKNFDFKQSGGPGKIRRALSFDGIDDTILLADPIKSDCTIAFWMKTNTAFEAVDNAQDNRPTTPLLTFVSSDFNVHMSVEGELQDGANHLVFYTDTPAQRLTSKSAVAMDQWVHVACSMKILTGEKTIYINGVKDNAITTGQKFFPGVNVLEVGSHEINKQYYQGMLDELRIYNRVLSDDEVLQVFCLSEN